MTHIKSHFIIVLIHLQERGKVRYVSCLGNVNVVKLNL